MSRNHSQTQPTAARRLSAPPAHTFRSIPEADPFLALFPHRHDYLWAEHPSLGQKPTWQTEHRHPLSDRLIQQGSYLYGVRFGPKTHYALLDIDAGSRYHPRCDPFAISRMVAALEPLGLVRYVACTSSYSGGIHLYFPFAKAQESYQLAQAIQALLENAGFLFSAGQLELFPNDRGFVDGSPALYAGHRLPMQAGSYLLNRDYSPIWSDQTTFVNQWRFAQAHNPLTTKTLRQVLKTAKRRRYRLSGKASKFLNDLVTEIYQGWSDYGQTNHLLGRIAMYLYIFGHYLQGCEPLSGKRLVNQIVELTKSLPGYRDYCRHQHEIEQRAEEWASCVESSRYFPYGLGKTNNAQNTEPEPQPPTWHADKQAEARERIRSAIARLLESNTLPAKPTARFNALVKHGIGGGTLYKHKDLWHPEYLMPVESPPPPPGLASERTESAPECTNLLAQKSSNKLPCLDFSPNQAGTPEAVSSNTLSSQPEHRGLEWVRQKVAEVRERQAYQRAAQQGMKAEHLQLQLHLSQHPAPERVAQMQQWLKSGDPILMAEAEVFFEQYPDTRP